MPSILHKYDIDDPESVIKAKRVFEDNRQENDDDDMDYGMNLRIVYRQTRGWYVTGIVFLNDLNLNLLI